MNGSPAVLGVIGGSGLYRIPALEMVREVVVDTPFGATSSPIVEGRLGGRTVFFLARHGRKHTYSPSEVPYRANIFALKSLGVTCLLSVSAVGSLRQEIAPGHLVVPDQIIDRTKGLRSHTFFEGGLVAHVAMADPYCHELRQQVVAAARTAGATVHEMGSLVCMEGPQFSSRAESHLYRSWGAHLIGMTVLPEAWLAREASLCYATLALATDYDCWHESHESVTVEGVIQVMTENAARACRTVEQLALAPLPSQCRCHQALASALVTRLADVPPEVRARLALLLPAE